MFGAAEGRIFFCFCLFTWAAHVAWLHNATTEEVGAPPCELAAGLRSGGHRQAFPPEAAEPRKENETSFSLAQR